MRSFLSVMRIHTFYRFTTFTIRVGNIFNRGDWGRPTTRFEKSRLDFEGREIVGKLHNEWQSDGWCVRDCVAVHSFRAFI